MPYNKVVSEETVVLRRWEGETNVWLGFNNRVD